MRRGALFVAAAVVALVLVACGRARHAEIAIADPTGEALAFAPAGAPVVAVVETDTTRGPGARLGALLRRFPGGELAASSVLGGIGLGGLEVLRPLAGHPVVAWADAVDAPISAAWVVADGDALGDLLDARRDAGDLKAAPGHRGFTAFVARDGRAFARRGPVLVTAPDLAGLRTTIDRRLAGRGVLSRRLVAERTLGLPEATSAARLLLTAPAALAALPAARALPVGRALTRAAVALVPAADGVRLSARAALDPRRLVPADLPLARGGLAPAPRGRARVVAGIRDPQQALRFARAATQALDPDRLKGLDEAEDVLRRYARVDLEGDLLSQLTGTATVTSDDGRTFSVRAEVRDPGKLADDLGRVGALARLGGPVARLAGIDLGGFDVDEDDGRYTLSQDGRPIVSLAVKGGAFVASTQPGADLDAVGEQAPAPTRGLPAQGALRAVLDHELLEDRLVALLGLPTLALAALGPLGDPVLTARTETGRLDAELVLPIAG